MALSVKADLEGYPQGIPLGIVGIGVVENGGDAVEVNESQENIFFTMNNNTIENVLKDQEGMEVSGSSDFTPPEGWEPPAEPEQQEPKPEQQPAAQSFGTTVTGETPEPPTEEGDG